VGAVTGVLRSEFRKMFSTRLWWGLLIPVAVLSGLLNLFGGLFTGAFATLSAGDTPPLLLGSLAYSLSLTTVFAAVHGIVASAGEFRHRTVTTTYLTARGRGRVLLAKAAAGAVMGALFAGATVSTGVLGGLAGSAAVPPVGALLSVTAVGLAVVALWGALGAALGVAIGNQVAALVVTLAYMLVVELLVSVLLTGADPAPFAQFAAYLPVNSGDVALYGIPADVLAGPVAGPAVVELLAGVSAPPPWWAALIVLAAWTAATAVIGWFVGARRDVT